MLCREARHDHGYEEAALAGAGGAQARAADRLLAEGKDVAAVCRELTVCEQTYYRWRNQFGALKAEDAKRLKELERENPTLRSATNASTSTSSGR
jgi:transposase-like protein